jgi:hypothetical protein
MSLQQLFPRALINTKPMNYGNKIKDKQYNLSINDALLRTSISIFYDFGYVKNKHKILPDYYNSNSGYMAGTGLALNYNGRYLDWSLAYGKILRSPAYLQTRDGIDKEGQSIYWRANIKW